MEKLSIQDLELESRTRLEAILAKDPAAMTEDDKNVLRARAAYLDANQRRKLADVLGDESDDDEPEESDDDEDEEEEEEGSESDDDEPDLESMSRKELDEVATELGLDPEQYRNKGEVIAAIQEKRSE